MNRKTEITFERRTITIIRAGGKQHSAHCERCGKTVTAFAPKQIADVLQVNLAEIFRRIEMTQIHLINDGDNITKVCANSFGETQTKYLSE